MQQSIERRLDKLGRSRSTVEIVHADLFDFLLMAPDHEPLYDWAFYDIWCGDGESTFHETVIPLLNLSRKIVPRLDRVLCWNEDVMRGQLLRGLQTRHHYAALQAIDSNLQPQPDPLIETGNQYIDWALPFWRAEQGKPSDGFNERATAYVAQYGRSMT